MSPRRDTGRKPYPIKHYVDICNIVDGDVSPRFSTDLNNDQEG